MAAASSSPAEQMPVESASNRTDGSARTSSLPRYTEMLVLLLLVVIGMATALIVPRMAAGALLSPLTAAIFLTANLLPAMALLVLIGRRIALRRAARGGGEGRLHTRLVALFSITAAVPTVVIVVLASFLFQSGMDYWFSDRSRGMFENALSVAQNFFDNESRDVGANALAMASDLRSQLRRTPMNSGEFYDYYVQQVVVRELSESAIIEVGEDGIARTPVLIDPDNRSTETRVPTATIARLNAGQQMVTRQAPDRVEAVVRLDPARPIYLYAARGASVFGVESVARAQSVFSDYQALYSRSRALQFRFLLTLYSGALFLIALVIAVAIFAAETIVRPIADLGGAAQRIASGDLEARVRSPQGRPDEIALVAGAFNRMASQLGEQTRALLMASEQAESRRAFIEAVLSGVSSGVVSLDGDGRIRLVNAAAAAMLGREAEQLVGEQIEAIVPALAAADEDAAGQSLVDVHVAGEDRTWAVKSTGDERGSVMTFEDVTQQLSDQRRAAWSDVARRIAHEIKNPLTPIQLAAERLQRRFGEEHRGEDVFANLTSTIIRQVGDLRRMVDEFSSFARMPKPSFRQENLGEILRQSMFLYEVSRPDILFECNVPVDAVQRQCDRRLLGQALSNLIKNATEAVERRMEQAGNDDGPPVSGHIWARLTIDPVAGGATICIEDDGAGLPGDRERILEPYVTLRRGGTGLGLAIVKRILEEHGGALSLADREGGGTVVTLTLPADGPPEPIVTADNIADDTDAEVG